MTHHEESYALDDVLQILADHGFDGLAQGVEILMNEAMKLQLSTALQTAPHERSKSRSGYANGFKPRAFNSRLCKLQLAVPHAGDARNKTVLQRAHLADSELVVLVVPDDDVALSVLRTIREITAKTPVIVRCRHHNNEHKLVTEGANHVISEEQRAAQAILRLLSESKIV